MRVDIIGFRADGSYVFMNLENGEVHHISRPLCSIISEFGKKSNFIEGHQSYFTNLKFVIRVSKGQRPVFVMRKGKSIPVSRERASKVRKLVRLYLTR